MRIVLLLALLGACSINHRSDEFTCTNSNMCNAGQTCQDGLCVTGGTPSDGPDVDPDGPPPDTFVCPNQCTSCNPGTNTCIVDCNASAATCASAINCPAGFNCDIRCTKNDGCQNINCTQGQSCKILCKGNNTCENVVCGPGPCDVECTGQGACGGGTATGIDCDASCACDVACNNNASCFPVSCPKPPGPEPLRCSGIGANRCTSEPDGCNTCM